MTTIAWVIGRGGLLGSALEAVLRDRGTALFVPARPFAWDDVAAFDAQVACESTHFADAALACAAWEIYWAAGTGTMGSPAAALDFETGALGALLAALVPAPGRPSLPMARGRLMLASSAGAVYGGSRAALITESAAVAPINAYGAAKLLQEALVARASADHGLHALVARISTLYGAGQASSKAQGLLTHMSRSILRNRPIQIFVPFDTIRDYIAAADAAAMIVAALRYPRVARLSVKIVASERPTTIAEIISLFRRVARRTPRIVTGAAPTTASYARRVQFRSEVEPLARRGATSLMVGISSIHAAERARYVRAAPSAPAEAAT